MELACKWDCAMSQCCPVVPASLWDSFDTIRSHYHKVSEDGLSHCDCIFELQVKFVTSLWRLNQVIFLTLSLIFLTGCLFVNKSEHLIHNWCLSLLSLHLRIYCPHPWPDPTATHLQSINHTLAMVPLMVMPNPPTRLCTPTPNSMPQTMHSLKCEHAMIIPLFDCSGQISESTPCGHRESTGLIQSSNMKLTQNQVAVDSKYLQIHHIQILTA